MKKSFGVAVSLIAATLTLGLAGCASGDTPSEPDGTTPGPDVTTPVPDETSSEVESAWLDEGRVIALVTWGSSSTDCTLVTSDVTTDGQTINVEFANPDTNAMCTRDFVPRATYLAVPDEIDTKQEVTVAFSGAGFLGELTLAGNSDFSDQPSGLDGTPSAGWYSSEGAVLLTWGSSSCPPIVESIDASDSGATVTVTSDEDKICTADFGPRLTLLALEKPSNAVGFTLTLVGDNLDGEVTVLE